MTPELERAYGEPHRRYHTRRHIEQCLALLDEVPDLTDAERQILAYAIWWHDAAYDPTASDDMTYRAVETKLWKGPGLCYLSVKLQSTRTAFVTVPEDWCQTLPPTP